MPHPELQCIALAAACRIRTNNHFDPCRPGNRGSVIRAIIRDHEDAITRSELSLYVMDGGKYSRSLVMRGNKYSRPMRHGTPGSATRRAPLVAQGKAARQDLGKPDQCQKGRQANDRNHDATQHGSHPVSNISIQHQPTRNRDAFRPAGVYYEFDSGGRSGRIGACGSRIHLLVSHRSSGWASTS